MKVLFHKVAFCSPDLEPNSKTKNLKFRQFIDQQVLQVFFDKNNPTDWLNNSCKFMIWISELDVGFGELDTLKIRSYCIVPLSSNTRLLKIMSNV